MTDKHCEVFVYLCEQNQSLPQFGSFSRTAMRNSDTLTNLNAMRRKTGSLEKLKIRNRFSAVSPLRSLFLSQSLTPWRSLRDLTKMSTSDSSVNNLDHCKDFIGSANHIDTDCVSPRVSSNSLASIQIDPPDVTDPLFGVPGESNSASRCSILTTQNLESVGTIYTQKKKKTVHSNLARRNFTFSRSTSCPLVVPALRVKRIEDQSATPGCAVSAAEKPKKVDSEDQALKRNREVKTFPGVSPPNVTDDSSTRVKVENPSRSDIKKSAMTAKSLARSKCMQWLNSLDEDD